jgi:hypothetical protein
MNIISSYEAHAKFDSDGEHTFFNNQTKPVHFLAQVGVLLSIYPFAQLVERRRV